MLVLCLYIEFDRILRKKYTCSYQKHRRFKFYAPSFKINLLILLKLGHKNRHLISHTEI